jgi:hypothetical protein
MTKKDKQLRSFDAADDGSLQQGEFNRRVPSEGTHVVFLCSSERLANNA